MQVAIYFWTSVSQAKANKGGVDEYADYCPRVYAYAEGDCRLGKSMDTRFAHGPSSRCIEMFN